MKKIWPSVACSTVLLSGCMYGSASAPITALNPNSNQYQQTSQYQPARAPVGQIQVNRGQAIALTPTRVPQPRAATVIPQQQPAPQQVRPAYPQQNAMVVEAQSPYGQPAIAQPYRPQASNNDGWAVSPQQTQQAQQQLPAIAQPESVQAAQSNEQANNQAQPVRPTAAQPSVVSQETNVNAGTVSNTATQSNQVASATPPQQPAAPAQGETAVSALLKKASSSLGKGDLDGAAAYLENAQRIEPQNVKILYDIANIRYHQGRYKDAENFAGRAVQAGGGNSMMKKSWALIANARKQLGDNQGAIAAAEKAASY